MRIVKLVASTFLLSLLWRHFHSYCIWKGPIGCDPGADPNCLPIPTDLNNQTDIAPKAYNYSSDLYGICPDYENVTNCCNPSTLGTLKRNLILVDINFGNPETGCSICSANLKRFWCKLNCDPNQNTIIEPGSAKWINYTLNPSDPSSVLQVATSNISIYTNTSCTLFQSCKSVEFVKDLGSMSTPIGFFNTLSTQGITQGNVLMNFSYSPDPTTLNVPINTCDMIFNGSVDQYNYSLYGGQSWCSCRTCSQNCSAIDYSMYIKEHGVLDGMNFMNIVKAAILAIVVLTIGLILNYLNTGSKKKVSNTESTYQSYSKVRS